jgi:dTDP-glucose pyrophosphorylase/CBS domain-containing protein
MIKKVDNLMKKNKFSNLATWEKALLPIDVSLQQVIANLNETSFKIVIIVSTDRVLVGTITDGDIRRGLLQGMGMESSIKDIIFHDPLVVPPQMAQETTRQLMFANKVQQIPIVDEKRRVVGVHLQENLMVLNKIPNLMVIMAGGQGTRLRPHTENCPKPLLPVAGKPILEHIIVGAKAEGFQHFLLAINYLADMIEDYCGDGSKWNVHIDYLREDSPLGTAGAIGLLDPQPQLPFVITNGDVLTDICYSDMLEYHCRNEASASMAVQIHEWQNPFGVVRTNGIDITGFEEKPIVRNHINAGVYVLEPDVLKTLKTGEHFDMPRLFSFLRDNDKRTIVYPVHEPWLDVGCEEDLRRAQVQHSPKS